MRHTRTDRPDLLKGMGGGPAESRSPLSPRPCLPTNLVGRTSKYVSLVCYHIFCHHIFLNSETHIVSPPPDDPQNNLTQLCFLELYKCSIFYLFFVFNFIIYETSGGMRWTKELTRPSGLEEPDVKKMRLCSLSVEQVEADIAAINQKRIDDAAEPQIEVRVVGESQAASNDGEVSGEEQAVPANLQAVWLRESDEGLYGDIWGPKEVFIATVSPFSLNGAGSC